VATSKNLKAPKTGDGSKTCKKVEVKVIKSRKKGKAEMAVGMRHEVDLISPVS
jgi:hypothetical protein